MARWITFVLLLVALIGAPVSLAQPDFPPELADQLQGVMDTATAGQQPPGMVVWIDTPTAHFAGASGTSDRATGAPMPPDGAFNIGSITKMFTATVVLQLAEEGALTLDDTLAQWLPDVAAQVEYGDQIQIHHLLDHTSGLPDYYEHPSYWRDLLAGATIEGKTVSVSCEHQPINELIETYVAPQEPTFAPGAKGQWAYSNTGYELLGLIIEQATGAPLADAYRSRILDPLGLTGTYLECGEEPTGGLVHAYATIPPSPILFDVTGVTLAVDWADGGLVSTAPDLIRFARALFKGELFQDPATLDAMLAADNAANYGYGVFNSGGEYLHTGGVVGYISHLSYNPTLDAVIVVLYNSSEYDFTPVIQAAYEVLAALADA